MSKANYMLRCKAMCAGQTILQKILEYPLNIFQKSRTPTLKVAICILASYLYGPPLQHHKYLKSLLRSYMLELHLNNIH